ncbi:hypothetical protein OsI_02920 [Oryza sativa Indica Group]|uniref:Water stress and hypersensitive response domain-containing protein n=1 Tax=Oryza sativa subsp. indica TaxID=39946 RepID=B8ABY5_ORYSI|nr:hypothetical protein OsI_02920 [Oryza sativa Indica Group]
MSAAEERGDRQERDDGEGGEEERRERGGVGGLVDRPKGHLDVNNPYSHRIPICELTYTFKSGDKVIASGTMPDPGWIAASGTTNLELPVKVPYDFIVSLIKDVSGDWDIDYVLEVGITIDLPVVGSFTIPLATEGEMKLPTFRDLLF